MTKILYSFGIFLFLFLLPIPSYAQDITSNWSTTTSLPYTISSHTSFSAGEKVSVIGGSSVTGQSKFDIKTSTPAIDGTLGNWATSALVPSALIWHSTILRDNYVYILGGREENPGSAGGDVNKVYKGELDSDGTVTSWQTLNPMPAGRSFGSVTIVGDRIYYAGGFNGSTRFADIFYADINPDGTLGTWTTSSISLPYVLQGFGMVSSGNYIFIIGGESNNISQSNVYSSLVNPDGSLNPWQATENLPQPLYRSSYIKDGDRLIAVGGQNGPTVLDKVYYTEINNDGTISEWIESEKELPIPVTGASVAKVGDYLYLAGGWNTGGYLNTVFYAKLDSNTGLEVPLIKQTSSPWNDDIYDSAHLWTSDTSFSRWGCAVTSAAMVFNYHGLTKMADNSDLDPGTLNSWLKSQPDGYVRNGLTNWLALSRLSRQISEGNEVDFDAFEFTKIFSTDHQLVKNNIDNGNPDILREPGHFVVAKGYSDDSILINDPYYDRDDLISYSNAFENISSFTPSSTDLSYIMLVVDANVDVKVFDENNLEVETVVVIDDPITDPSGSSETSAQPLKTVYIKKPDSGKYRIEISGTGNYLLDVYLYDEEGDVKQLTFDGNGQLGTNNYNVTFGKENSSNSSVIEEVTYDSLIKDIKFLYQNHEIKKLSAYLNILTRTKLAMRFQWNNNLENRFLDNLVSTIVKLENRGKATAFAKEYLLKKIEILKNL